MKFANDELLLWELKSGNCAAFDQIYSSYSKMLYIYLENRLKDPGLCSDIIQDVFISLWEKREYLFIETSLKAYLYQSVKFKIIDQYRKNSIYQRYMTDLGTYMDVNCTNAADNIDHKNRLTAVMGAIDVLPNRMKEIFKLSRFEHLPVKSIAEKLSLSPQTVKNQLTKALHVLREQHAEVH
ncbi:RNA polymerase sigma factor [Arcticibacter eurypsychrophilus]|uniref:RNA polymerase sigma factor n=1 Tax=Arcticibacter eurypsychrophilus TaxID=1434752 RepID=UPI00084D6EBE|nr:RNA polymerase sigma-70 factor [Arcticibacter eurypsychrophilus]